MNITDIAAYIVLGVIFIGLPIFTVIRLRHWLKQKKLGGSTVKPTKTLTIEQHRQFVEKTPQLLFYLGGWKILFAILFNAIPLLTPGFIFQIVIGIIYIALGLGARRKSKLALALAIPICAVDGINSLISSATVRGWSLASCVSPSFIIFIIFILWQGVKSMRVIEKEEEGQQELTSSSKTSDNALLN